jgi:two-component system, chemotaxis family, CheB/CheR fusion protein
MENPMISTASPSKLELQMRDMNESLLISSLRQHELVEQAEKANAALRENEERYRTLFELCPVAVYSCDLSGLIQQFNRRAVELWGRTPALGDTDEQFCGSFRLYRPDGSFMPHEQCPMAEVLSGKVAGICDGEVLIERPDGSRITAIVNIHALKNDRGEITGALNCFYDVTERKHGEELLRQSEQKLASLVESSNDPIITKSLDGIIQSWNPAAQQLFGYTADQAVNRPGSLIIPADKLDEERQIIARVRAGERVEHFDTVRVRKDGTRIEVSLTISPIKDTAGRVVGVSKIARDITNEKRLQAELRQADNRKNEFLAMLAHELRNPLAPISHALQILRLTPGKGEVVESAAELMQRQVGQMIRLVDDLLDVNRLDRGKIELRKGRIELASAVNHAVEANRAMYESRKHELTVTLPPEPIYMNADPIRLAQIVGNLLNNACKFTENGGRISLAVQREGKKAVIRVTDSGIGIAADQLPCIFDMFTQIDTSLERSVSGLGIGLTLVKSLVEMHGGTVEAHSAGVGAGSEFVVRLPIIVEIPQAAPMRSPAGKPAAATGRRILVVDDNRDSAASLAMLLSLAGNQIQTACDGLEAVAAAETFKPDVVLMDIGLPNLNGYEACRRIREQPWGKNMIMMALTGWGQEEDKQKSKIAGFDGHLVKPAELASIMKLLAELQPITKDE